MTIRYTLTAAATGIALLLTVPVHAGGPVLIVEEAYEAEPTPKLTPGQKIAIAAGFLIVGGLLLGGGGSDGPSACTCNGPDDGGDTGCGC